MKKLCAFVLCVIVYSPVSAQTSGTGIGIIAGEPTGFSVKFWLGAATAVDGAVAWSFSGDGALHVHADYLFHKFDLFSEESSRIVLYYGAGGRVKFGEGERKDIIGVRVPVGLLYPFEGAPIDIFLEVVPMIDVVPDTDFDLGGAVGARYFF